VLQPFLDLAARVNLQSDETSRSAVKVPCDCGTCKIVAEEKPIDFLNGRWASWKKVSYAYGRPAKWQPLYQDCGTPLGGGAYGKVFDVLEKGQDDIHVAVKIQKKNKASDNELAMLLRFKHTSHIVTLLNHDEFEDRYDGPSTAFAMEKAQGTLEACLGSSPATKVKLFSHILAGVRGMHIQHVAHRDLKPDNVFMYGDCESGVARLGDLGLACETGSLKCLELSEYGTFWYMAPELVGAWIKQSSRANDMWATGLILHVLVFGHLPEPLNRKFAWGAFGKMPPGLRKAIKGMKAIDPETYRLNLTQAMDAPVRTLLSGLLQPDPKKRLTAEQALEIIGPLDPLRVT